MLITDYIDLTFLPLYSAVEKYLFKKESHTSIKNRNLFDSEMQSVLKSVASSFSIPLKEGVYCWLKGPSYETASEIRMFSRLGADAVGMSTVPEIYFAYMSGMKSIAISLISNLATGLSQTKLTHEEVTEAAEKVKHQFADLIIETIKRLDSR